LFVLVWLIGDICNLLGAVLANLLPTVILLGLYYSLCDTILLGQIYYYKWKRHSLALTHGRGERAPLLAASLNEQPSQSISTSTPTSTSLFMLRYACATCFVIFVGIAASWLSEGTHSAVEPGKPPMAPQWLIQTLGWASAISYLGARIPQIFKNFKTRCEGLSPALFFFAILGNTAYGLSICAKSMDPDYLVLNASWLAGSILTVFLDILVVAQFFYYRSVDHVDMSVFL